jgi:hypothetical protein
MENYPIPKGGEMMMEKHDFISAHKSRFPVSRLCDLLDVSRSWFYERQRLHSTIGYKTPLEAFNEMSAQAA